EMFLSKDPANLEKHLPNAARQSLVRKGDNPATSLVGRIASVGQQLEAGSEHLETFETGPTLLIFENRNGHDKIEVTVERDDLLGEENEIELSVHPYKDGELEAWPVVPRLIFSMKQEKEIWKLSEITLSVHAPLTDPEYLKNIRKLQNEQDQNRAMMSARVLVMAEDQYATGHPARGYTCALVDLGSKDGLYSLVDPELAGGQENGYVFSITGCDGPPATKFQVGAIPADPDAGMRTFCIDQSGALRFSTDGSAKSCMRSGQPIQ
ncbi:MAG TPA: hypothetical protein VKI40_03650, partial [Terriglobales bacterium]|nr:hypothetical protein [Terriglobales bacterium]